jgi:predicted outer membrane protein
MSKQHWATGALAVSAMMVTGVARAGVPQQSSNNPASGLAPSSVQRTRDWNQQGRTTAGRTNLDHYIIKVVTQANRDEIAQGQLANQRSSNQDVKKFAMQMVQDHTRLLNKLQQFRGERRSTAPGTRQPSFTPNRASSSIQPARSSIMLAQATSASDTANDHNATPGAVNNAAAGTATTQSQDNANDHNAAGQANPAPAAGAYNQQPGVTGRGFGSRMAGQPAAMGQQSSAREFAQMMDEVSQQTEKSIQRELSQKEGVQFDRCYLSWQVLDHIWLIDALTVFERNASPALRPVLQEGLQTAQQHLTHAKALLARVESQSKSTAQRDSTTIQSR